jgi:chemotaxis response regulator CheB
MVRSILIVDDNAFIRKALCEMFKREEDFDICGEAENGRDAIEKAKQLRPDLIVLDLSNPKKLAALNFVLEAKELRLTGKVVTTHLVEPMQI